MGQVSRVDRQVAKLAGQQAGGPHGGGSGLDLHPPGAIEGIPDRLLQQRRLAAENLRDRPRVAHDDMPEAVHMAATSAASSLSSAKKPNFASGGVAKAGAT